MSEPVFRPTLRSLRKHRVPAWYEDAKFGVFIHWSVSSVIGWAPRERDINEVLRQDYDNAIGFMPYTEWYQNSIRIPGSPAAEYHRAQHKDRSYASFAADFERGIAGWNPRAWAAAFRQAGARYVVLVSKHHDGYCLWPSSVPNPHRANWFSTRNCVRELAAAVRSEGMRFGIYYSGGLDWTFDATPLRTIGDVIAAMPGGDYATYAEAQLRELIGEVQPDVLWNDISWPAPAKVLYRMLSDYYAAAPEGVVNDRWLPRSPFTAAMRNRHLRGLFDAFLRRNFRRPGAALLPPNVGFFDFQTPEYVSFPDIRRRKWECVRGMDKSFGFNRNSRPDDLLSRDELIHSFVDIVAKNGNLLLNVGPRGEDAMIPEAQLDRLAWVGEWLADNGEAIYASRPWVRAAGVSVEGMPLRFTARDCCVYAIALGTPADGQLTIGELRSGPATRVRLLGHDGPIEFVDTEQGLRLTLPRDLPRRPAYSVELEHAVCR